MVEGSKKLEVFKSAKSSNPRQSAVPDEADPGSASERSRAIQTTLAGFASHAPEGDSSPCALGGVSLTLPSAPGFGRPLNMTASQGAVRKGCLRTKAPSVINHFPLF